MHGSRTIIAPANYTIFTSPPPLDGGFHGGTAILVQHGMPFLPIDLDTNFDAIAVRGGFPGLSFSICSLYLPPQLTVSTDELQRLIAQIIALPFQNNFHVLDPQSRWNSW